MTTNENAPVEGTREQLETLARWMGWEVNSSSAGRVGPTWNPFTDANADYQVLERAREVWRSAFVEPAEVPWTQARADARYSWFMFSGSLGDANAYVPGDYARAVLAVLGRESVTHTTV